MNAPGLRSRSGSFGGVGLDGPSVARSAKEGELLQRIPPKILKIPRALARGASFNKYTFKRYVDMNKSGQDCTEVVLGKVTHGDELIFIGGPPRSGTTLVQNMLDMHPDIIGVPEFLHLPDIIRLRQSFYTSISRGWLELYCSNEQVDIYLRSLIARLFQPVRSYQEAGLISEKTPENVRVFSGLAELFPGARFINVVRDPRAIVASMLQVYARAREKKISVYPNYTTNTPAAIRYTQQCFNAGFAATSRFADRFYTVLYENLVRRPEEETKKICEFLQVEWNPKMIRPSTQKHLGEKAITANSGEIWYDLKGYYSDPDTRSIDKWRDELSSSQQVMVTRAFKDSQDLARLGYGLEMGEFSWGSRALELCSRRMHQLRHIAWK